MLCQKQARYKKKHMKMLLALTVLFWFTSTVYFIMNVNELKSNLVTEKALYKACEAERMWLDLKLQEPLETQ